MAHGIVLSAGNRETKRRAHLELAWQRERMHHLGQHGTVLMNMGQATLELSQEERQ